MNFSLWAFLWFGLPGRLLTEFGAQTSIVFGHFGQVELVSLACDLLFFDALASENLCLQWYAGASENLSAMVPCSAQICQIKFPGVQT